MHPTSVKPSHGNGALSRRGRPKGSKSPVTKVFEEFAKATLSDPNVQARIRGRLAQELNRKTGPVPILLALIAASGREKPGTRGGAVTFIAQIVNGRGDVRRVDLGELRKEAVEQPALPALRAAVAGGEG